MQQMIQGQVTALEQRQGGWVAVSIHSPGKNYPVKLSTKDQQLIGTAQQLVMQMVDALFNEEQSTSINPHTNQPYTNRYLVAVAPAGTLASSGLVPAQQTQPQGGQLPQGMATVAQVIPQVMPPAPIQQPTMQQRMPDAQREDRIMRQTATKVAAAYLPFLDEGDRNLASLIRISEQLMRYYKEGVSWTTNPVQPAQQPMQTGAQQVGQGPGYGDEPDQYAHDDSDVPF